MLFGVTSGKDPSELYIQEKDHVPLKTGKPGYKIMKNGPKHIMDADQLEPLYIHQTNILEECLKKEAERMAHQENLFNRVVYDSEPPSPPQKADSKPKDKEDGVVQAEGTLNLPSASNCDNDATFEDSYKSTSPSD